MKLLILGNGAVGRVIAYRLACAGAAVARWVRPGHLGEPRTADPAWVQISGLESGQALSPRVHAEAGQKVDPDTVVVLTVKAFQTEQVLREVSPCLNPGQLVILCENGLGAADRAFRGWPQGVYVRATCWFGAVARGLDDVELRGHGRIEVAEELRAAPFAPADVEVARQAWLGLDHFLQALEASGQEISDRAQGWSELEWRKALLNVSLNAVCALAQVPNGKVLEKAELREQVENLLFEALELARSLGVEWDEESEVNGVWEAIRRTAANRNSAWQDLEAGRPTEIPWLNGEVARLGQRWGIPVPTHQAIFERFQDLAEGRA